MNHVLEKTTEKHIVKVFIDEDPETPRAWDNLGEILINENNRYVSGDKQVSREYLENATDLDEYIWLPVYAFVHGSVALNTTGFSCPWDSGQIGVIRVLKSKVLKEYGWKRLSKARVARIEKYLNNEIEVYNQYLNGEVYGFEVTDLTGQHVDSCWGFYETPEQIAEEALKNVG